jgi:hypothetical protein
MSDLVEYEEAFIKTVDTHEVNVDIISQDSAEMASGQKVGFHFTVVGREGPQG